MVGGWVAAGVLAGAAGCATPPPPAAAPGPVRVPESTASASASASGTPDAGLWGTQPERPTSVCPEGGVRLLEDGPGDAAMGLRLQSFRLVNCGSDVYELNGYPEVRLSDGENRPVAVEVGNGSAPVTSEVPSVDAPPVRVVLAPGAAASVTMVWRNRVTDVTVPAVEGWVLDVRPRPGAPRVSLRLSRPVDLGNTGQLGTGAWQPLTR
ncbi:DUF4232 domain-containing protein [Streptomyces sp. NPDC058674]|uniref:DUF4232 domain-containing protein n=1 Tax=Streptomyces sp. NPDC058674 TaxID=3346592 RepID=UPI003650EB9C